jgi:Mrp family chromosome partitioning ATPase
MKNNIDVLSMIQKFYRYKFGVLAILISILIGASIYIKTVVPIYLSSILIDVGENESLDIKSLFPNSKVLNIDMENKLEYDASILKSQHVIDEVLKKIDFSKRFFIKRGWQGYNPELYGENIPFKVDFRHLSTNYHNCTLMIEPLDSSSFKFYLNNSKIGKIYRYGERIEYLFYTITVAKSGYIQAEKGKKYLLEIETSKEILTSRILGNLSIEKEANRLLKIGYKDSIPERGKYFLSQLVFHYQKYILNSSRHKDEAYGDILDKKILFMDEELRLIGKKISIYKSEHKELLSLGLEDAVFSDVLDKDRSVVTLSLQLKALSATKSAISNGKYSMLLLENNGLVTEDIKKFVENIRDKKEKLGLFKQQKRRLGTLIVKNESYVKMLNELHHLERELTALSIDYTVNHPTYQKINRDVMVVRRKLNRYVVENIKNYSLEIKKIKKEIEKSLNLLSKNLKIQFNSLSKSLKNKRKSINSLPKSLMALEKLKRDFTTKENSYKILLKKRVEISVTTSSISNIQIVDNASSTLSPIKPKKAFLYLSFFVVGLILTIVYISFSIRRDRKLYSEKDISSESYETVIHSEKKGINDSFWRLISLLEKKLISKKSSIILLTSNSYIEPKSMVLEKISLLFNNISKKVLIIDFDTYNPQVDAIFKGNSKIGLSNILTSNYSLDRLNIEECIYPHDINIDILPSGPIIQDNLKLLFSNQIGTLLEIFSKKYDVILLDTAPMGEYPVTDILLKYIDLVLIVAQINKSDRTLLDNLESKSMDKVVFLIK